MSSGINIRDNKFSFSDLAANLKFIDNIELGYQPNKTNSGAHTIAIGSQTGIINQGTFGIAIGYQAGQLNQGSNAIAIGEQAGQLNQGSDAITIGEQAGQDQQKPFAIAVGTNAGQNNQGTAAIALGSNAGYSQQELYSVSMGTLSGYNNQGTASVAIGTAAGQMNQSANNIAIGNSAGQMNQGTNSIAIGSNTGQNNQPSNSIILNASGNPLNSTTSGLFLNPVRKQDNDFVLLYKRDTFEIIKRTNVFNYVGDLKYSSRMTDDDQWLICDGRSLLVNDYPELFAVIEYTFGGSGANFNLPNPRSRVLGAIGQGSGLTNRTLGQNVGTETHTLTINQMPGHTHTITDPGHTHLAGGNSQAVQIQFLEKEVCDNDFLQTNTGVSTTGITINSSGGGQSHDIMQPTLFIGNLFVYAKYIDYTG
jgi:microcystin-dependent protein